MDTKTSNKVKVYSMTSPRTGNAVPNQFEIQTDDGVYFQSYSSIIAFKPLGGTYVLDETYWDYSRTTRKYLCQFLRMNKKEIISKIDSGDIILADLN